jgi:hypothetical protein
VELAYEENDHSLGVHALSDVEFVVLEVTDNLLGKLLSTLLESSDSVGVAGLELSLDGLHVTLEVGKVGLEVSCGSPSQITPQKVTGTSRGTRLDVYKNDVPSCRKRSAEVGKSERRCSSARHRSRGPPPSPRRKGFLLVYISSFARSLIQNAKLTDINITLLDEDHLTVDLVGDISNLLAKGISTFPRVKEQLPRPRPRARVTYMSNASEQSSSSEMMSLNNSILVVGR